LRTRTGGLRPPAKSFRPFGAFEDWGLWKFFSGGLGTRLYIGAPLGLFILGGQAPLCETQKGATELARMVEGAEIGVGGVVKGVFSGWGRNLG